MFSFDARKNYIGVNGLLFGPTGARLVRFALDTGATLSSLSEAALLSVGYDLEQPTRVHRVETGVGAISLPEIEVQELLLLGQRRVRFPMVAQTFSFEAPFDGLLGLDFLRDHRLCLDFARGEIELT